MAIATEIIPEATPSQRTNDTAAALRVPWGLHPLEDWITEALMDRAFEYNPEPTINPQQYYAGPRTAWGRIFSTGISKDDKIKNRIGGFVLGGPEDFNSSYGFGSENQVIIGRTSANVPHTIPANAPGDLPHRPPPSLVSIESELLSGQNSSFPGAVRKVNVIFKCHNLTQLKYLVPYFFTPRIPVVVEWGWNSYNPQSLLNLSDVTELKKAYINPAHSLDRIKKSKGNYEVAIGQIFDYGYNLNEAGGYDCFVTIQNSNLLIEGRAYPNTTIEKPAETGAATIPAPASGWANGRPQAERTDKVKLQDFLEFVFDELGNVSIPATTAAQRSAERRRSIARNASGELGAQEAIEQQSSDIINTANQERERFTINISSNGRVFRPNKTPNAPVNTDQKTWLRMDMVVEIINKFFELIMLDSDGNETGVVINRLNIDNVKICAHPAIKSINKNILLPNKLAPRFTTKTDNDDTNASGKLSTITIENVEYFTLFKEAVQDIIGNNPYTDDFDNLQEIINPNGNSFPVFKDEPYTDPFQRKLPGIHKAGYWGYLSDVFIDVKHFQDLVRANDTLKTLIESLLKSITAAMSDICALKLIVPDGSNSIYTVIDNNSTPVTDTQDSFGFPIIALNSINSAYLKSATLSVKVSNDMAAQMVLQSASNKQASQRYGQGNNDPKTMPVSSNSEGSLLFDIGVHNLSVPSNKSDNSPKAQYTRLLAPGSGFYTYKIQTETNETVANNSGGTTTKKVSIIKEYILIEKDVGLMRSILNNKKDKNATYVNNIIMPGTKFEMELLGIGGIRYLAQFKLGNVLDQYNYENAVWQVSMIKHKVEDKVWTTYIMAEARPWTTIQTTTDR